MHKHLVLVLALLTTLSAAALAGPVPYTGHLVESGTPVNGTRTIALKVYDAASSGTVLHSQSEDLVLSGGVYHTLITASDAIMTGGDRWIGVSVNGGSELSPRVKYYSPPHVSPILVVRPPTIVPAVPSTWTKVDSLSITAPVNGVITLNVTGYGQWNGGTGSGTPTGASAIFSISETTPASAMTLMRTYSGGDGFSVTAMLTVTAGPHTYYFWARTLSLGTTFEVDTGLYQALYFPN